MSNEIIGHAKVIKTPLGAAPLEVRAAWVGEILPYIELRPYTHGSQHTNEYNIKTIDDSPERPKNCKNLFIVPKMEALEILEKKNPAARQWFREHASSCGNFTFGDDELEVIS